MSLLTLGSVGIGRDLAKHGHPLAKGATVSKTRVVALAPSSTSTQQTVPPPAAVPPGGPPPPAPPSGGGTSGAGTSADSTAGSVASFGQLLVAQIPSEALIAYTTLLALFGAGGSSYQPGRWVVYGATIAVCAGVVVSSYIAQRDYEFDDAAQHPEAAVSTGTRLHLPVLPMIAAMMSMAVYGLTVPGSPLQGEVSATAFGICSGCLAVGGGVMMSIFAPFLGKGNGAKPVAKQQ